MEFKQYVLIPTNYPKSQLYMYIQRMLYCKIIFRAVFGGWVGYLHMFADDMNKLGVEDRRGGRADVDVVNHTV